MALVKAGAIFLTVLVGLISGVLGTCLALWVHSAWPKSITETSAVLLTGFSATFIAALAVIIAVWGVVSARQIARRQATLEHIARVEADGTIQESLKEFNKIARAGTMVELAAKDKEGTEDLQHVLNVINQFELSSIGIQRGIIEPELYARFYRTQVLFAWKNSQTFVVALRARVDSTSIYHEFEEMARWMNQNRMPHRQFWWAGII